MSPQERIVRMVAEGKITPQEAEVLLTALDTPTVSYSPITEDPVQLKEIQVTEGQASKPLYWIDARLTSTDLNIQAKPGLAVPKIEGDVQVEQQGQALVITEAWGAKMQSNNPAWEVRLSDEDDLRIQVPAGWGLICELMSGDLEARGLAFVRGQVMSGDVALQEIEALELAVYSGDVNAHLELTEGQHRLQALSGDVHLDLGKSSVRISGQLLSGDLVAKGAFHLHGNHVEGVVREGTAGLELSVLSGDLNIQGEAYVR
jgi:hypothetical protein